MTWIIGIMDERNKLSHNLIYIYLNIYSDACRSLSAISNNNVLKLAKELC